MLSVRMLRRIQGGGVTVGELPLTPPRFEMKEGKMRRKKGGNG